MEKRPSRHIDVVAIEKGAFRSSSTKVANFTYYTHIVSVAILSDLL